MVEILRAISLLIAKRTDAILAMAVVGIVFMMILPLPTWVVDILLAINISVSSLMIVLALYMPGPLAFSTFPAFLLITTLFRLGLSITTTRLILLQGDAGEIVEAFGNFVVGGNLVVGIVIFLILLIVNFLVITKGSERVAEVSARFTLDAMPGKQMSIDSDLRGGLIDGVTAQNKRKSLAKESQLFGAMDGAMKFVKGDAIAGIIIVLVNIIGGYSIGTLQQGLPGNEALQLYAILTIGDGLVAQIPTLLIALSAGMIITRVKDDVLDKTNVGQEMAEQLTSEPKAWVIASVVLLIFAVIPGMPTRAFIFIAIIFLSVGFIKIFIRKSDSRKQTTLENEDKISNGTSDVATFEVYEPLTMVVNTEFYGTKYFEELTRCLRKQRNNLVANYGFILPAITFEVRSDVPVDNFQFRLYEVIGVNCTVAENSVAVAAKEQSKIERLGIEYAAGGTEREESDLLWIDSRYENMLNENEVVFESSMNIIGNKVKLLLRKEGYQFVGVDEAKKIIDWIGMKSPELTKEIERILPIAKLSEIFRSLVKESVSLRSLKKIVELIVKHGESERDIPMLTELVRIGLRDQICTQITMGHDLSVCLLDGAFENSLRESLRKTATGGFLEISDEDRRSLVDRVIDTCKENLSNKSPIALVVSQDIRPYIRALLAEDVFELPVLSYTELSPRINVVPIARLANV